MLDVLGQADSRETALAHFARSVRSASPREAEVLREALDERPAGPDARRSRRRGRGEPGR